MTIDFKALAERAAAAGADQTKAVTGGGDYTPPAAGPGLARFIGYVELGKQKGTFKGAPVIKEKVQLIFELVGKRHATAADEQPHRVTVEETYSLNEKANFFKLFQRMNYRQDAQHICALLGEGFKVEVVHDKWTGTDGKERIDVQFRDASGAWTIQPPRRDATEEDVDDGTGYVVVAVPPARSDIRCFLWDHCDLAQWGGLFIEGEYAERKDKDGKVTHPAKSKNALQNKIKNATNFNGSPIYNLLAQNGQNLDIPDVGEQEGNDDGQQTTNPTGATGTSAGAAASSTTSPSNVADAMTGIV